MCAKQLLMYEDWYFFSSKVLLQKYNCVQFSWDKCDIQSNYPTELNQKESVK